MGAHAFNPSHWEAKADGSLWVKGQSGLHSEFQNSQGYYMEEPCLKTFPPSQPPPQKKERRKKRKNEYFQVQVLNGFQNN